MLSFLFILKKKVCVTPRLDCRASCEHCFVVRDNVWQGIITKLSIESRSARKLFIFSDGKFSVGIKVFQLPNLLL